MQVEVSLIVARAQNGVIGHNNQLPWHLPGDLKYFKAITLGHAIIMGRKTWESIGKPLPKRKSIVVSSGPRPAELPEEVIWVSSLKAAIREGQIFEQQENPGSPELFIIGGAQLFAAAMPLANRFYLTAIEEEVQGDTTLPLNLEEWILESDIEGEADNKTNLNYRFQVWTR